MKHRIKIAQSERYRTAPTYNDKKWCDGKVRDYINSLIDEFACRMFKVENNHVYLLLNHHKYANFRDAKMVKLGKCKAREGYYYHTERL